MTTLSPQPGNDSNPEPHATNPVNILCMKWGDAYGPEYVNRLYAGVKRHLTIPHRFICFTDDATGLHDAVEHFPIPEVEIPDGELDLRWRKLAVFKETLYDLKGTALFLDLDVVIMDSLDDFFTHPGEFLIIRDDDLALPKPFRWLNPSRAVRVRRVGNSSVFRFEIGSQSQILENFLRDPGAVISDQPNFREQEFLTEELYRQGILRYWPSSWCVSFKYHCLPFFGTGYFGNPAPPPGAKIIIFAGSLNIPDAIAGKSLRWYRRLGPADWLAREWHESPGESENEGVR